MEYSHYQYAIFDWVMKGSGSGEIIAPAGSGKTFTGVQSVRFMANNRTTLPNIVYLAFNKHIQVELQSKLPDYATARTYHSFGLAAINNRRLKISEYKNSDLLKGHFGRDKEFMFPLISRITGLFKGNLLDDVTHLTVNKIIDQYGLELEEDQEDLFDDIVEGVSYLLDPSHVERLGKIDFDDMIWYPLVMNMPIPKVDFLLVDEYQDSNASQAEMVMRARNGHDGRVMAIGDPNQAIYHWRGAGSESMENFAERMNATILPLSISYRSPLAVVRMVNEKYPHIPFEAWDGAIEGSVNEIREGQMFQQVMPGDMVLCRLNAPLVQPAMHLLKEGKKVVIKGRDIGKNLITLIKQVERKYLPTNILDFLSSLDDYTEKENAKLRSTNRHSQADLLEDKRDTIFAFAEGAASSNEIKENIEKIYADDTQAAITFSSAHRSKGLQAKHVYILHPELMPFKRAKTAEAKKQEINLSYVADTRAQESLNYVIGG